MAQAALRQDIYRYVAGPLGHIEGLTLTSVSTSNQPSKQSRTHYFGGIPYALPPVGPYRFRRPRALPDQYRFGTKSNPARFTGKTALCPQPRRLRDLDESLLDEHCLQLNIHIPAKPKPAKGWPVFFYIHGGFLQWGTANEPSHDKLLPLLTETAFEGIVVTPSYRTNLFGFLSSNELKAEAEKAGDSSVGNMGFWDQRLALEFTAKNIRYFGGDPQNITVGGYSAGAHSAFHQLAHELYFVPDHKAIIKRSIMWSNSPGVQARTPAEHQAQFDELLDALNIPRSLSADEKLKQLRHIPFIDLVNAQDKLKRSEFRATTDGSFVSRHLIDNINNGDFGRRMKARGIKLMTGECKDENTVYQGWRPPTESYDAVRTRLIADYPENAVDRLMDYYCHGSRALPSFVQTWVELFGRIYADMQVHGLQRGFLRGLERGGLIVGKDVLRYRLEWRAGCVDNQFPRELGVTHASDMSIWFWGLYGELTVAEKEVLSPINKAFADFIEGRDPNWPTRSMLDMLRLGQDGKIEVWVDALWAEKLTVWDLVAAGPKAKL